MCCTVLLTLTVWQWSFLLPYLKIITVAISDWVTKISVKYRQFSRNLQWRVCSGKNCRSFLKQWRVFMIWRLIYVWVLSNKYKEARCMFSSVSKFVKGFVWKELVCLHSVLCHHIHVYLWY